MKNKNQKLNNSKNKSEKYHSEAELESIFDSLKSESFPELPNSVELVFKEMKVLGYASPFSLHLHINIDRVNEFDWPREAVVGLLAHELSHMVSYTKRSYLGRVLFIWKYRFSKKAKHIVECEADEIAINKGYKKELILARTLAIRDYSNDRVDKMRGVYYWPEELEKIDSGYKMSS